MYNNKPAIILKIEIDESGVLKICKNNVMGFCSCEEFDHKELNTEMITDLFLEKIIKKLYKTPVINANYRVLVDTMKIGNYMPDLVNLDSKGFMKSSYIRKPKTYSIIVPNRHFDVTCNLYQSYDYIQLPDFYITNGKYVEYDTITEKEVSNKFEIIIHFYCCTSFNDFVDHYCKTSLCNAIDENTDSFTVCINSNHVICDTLDLTHDIDHVTIREYNEYNSFGFNSKNDLSSFTKRVKTNYKYE